MFLICDSIAEEMNGIIKMSFTLGWTPQTFTSSRKSRAEHKKQSIYNFLDEEDIKVCNAFFLLLLIFCMEIDNLQQSYTVLLYFKSWYSILDCLTFNVLSANANTPCSSHLENKTVT